MAVVVLTNITQSTTPRKGRPKRGLRGAFFGLPYVGPLLSKASSGGPSAPTHADGVAAGGVEDSTGYRKSDTFDQSGNTGGLTGGPATSVSRPTGRTAYIGAGVPGGSAPGDPIDSTGRATSTGVDRFGRTKGVANAGAGLGTYKYTNFDGRTNRDGEGGRALGNDGRGSMASDGETVTFGVTAPTVGSAAGPAAGTIGVINGGAGGTIDIDLHADDITGGAAGNAGFEVAIYKRDTDDTDEDLGSLLANFIVDGGTDILDPAFTDASIAGTTVVVYARKRYPADNAAVNDPTAYGFGPWSARTTLAVT